MIPYGYKIVGGTAVPNQEEAKRLYTFFKSYSEGKSISAARETAGLEIGITTAKQALRRPIYVGREEGYPPLIPPDLYAAVQEELARRTHAPTRKKQPTAPVYTRFRLKGVPGPTSSSHSSAACAGSGVARGAFLTRLYACVIPDQEHGHEIMTVEEVAAIRRVRQWW